MMLFTTTSTDRAFEKAMQAKPNFDRQMPEISEPGGNKIMFFRGSEHQHLFERERVYHPGIDQDFCAVLYLLTADSHLWHQIKDQVTTHDVHIEEMFPQGLSAASYLYFKAAQEIVTGNSRLTMIELADRSTVSLASFRVLYTALTIKGYGIHAAEWRNV